MPIYLYNCRRCHETKEYNLPNSQAMPLECKNEECGVDGVYLDREYHGQTVSAGNSPEKTKSMSLTNLITGEVTNVPLKFVGSHTAPNGSICEHYQSKKFPLN